ncbi:MAG: LON peptidase substrate-binding domain-containing protein [Candidatus Competibacteraceae bacterium]|nr:LON peptidase substrate-binding domain-containing protein [Candidatus Competibacteraceae bacterium]
MSTLEIPLFPLKTVLFPGGVLPLRIFEPRYLDMVSQCLKSDSRFGVVAIVEGNEAGTGATFAEMGTLAQIVDFDQLEDGLLGLTCRGGERFTVLEQQQQADGLILGKVLLLPAEAGCQIDASHSDLVRFLRDLLSQDSVRPYRQWLTEDWTNTSWLGYRITELLPLPLPLKSSLLEMQEAEQRLDILQTILRDNKLLGN